MALVTYNLGTGEFREALLQTDNLDPPYNLTQGRLLCPLQLVISAHTRRVTPN
jgi:hypothetical protein